MNFQVLKPKNDLPDRIADCRCLLVSTYPTYVLSFSSILKNSQALLRDNNLKRFPFGNNFIVKSTTLSAIVGVGKLQQIHRAVERAGEMDSTAKPLVDAAAEV